MQADDLLKCDRVRRVNNAIGRGNFKPVLTGTIHNEVELILLRPEFGTAKFVAGWIVGYKREFFPTRIKLDFGIIPCGEYEFVGLRFANAYDSLSCLCQDQFSVARKRRNADR